ncbi:MAG: ATP-binding protein [Magnetococcus sp. DMHC-6]
MRSTSLQSKLIMGYYAISAMALCLSLFTIVELRTVSQRMVVGEQAFLLLSNVLEMRRFEKNYFLYQQKEDFDHLLFYVHQAKNTLNEAVIFDILYKNGINSVKKWLFEYEKLVQNQIVDSLYKELNVETKLQIRNLGKVIVTSAEDILNTERIQVGQTLEQHRIRLIIALMIVILVVILLGRALSQRIVLPLRSIEESMSRVARGQTSKILIQSNDREILSLTNAFNGVLHELDLRQKNLLRTEKLAALGTLLSGVAHELNNPLSNISTSCQILAEEVELDDLVYKKELLAQIDGQTRRARDIVRSLLDFSRDREFHKEPVPLLELMQEVVRFSKGNIPNRIRVKIDLPANLILLGDRQRLQQAFINLLTNALDAITDEGEVVIQSLPQEEVARVSHAFDFFGGRCRSPWTEIHVRDTGSGISKEHLTRIFDPFFTTKPIGKGSGLGLSVVFDVVEEHEGFIVAESQLGQGTLFRIRLPIVSS